MEVVFWLNSLLLMRRRSSSYYGNRGMGMRVDQVVWWTNQALKIVYSALFFNQLVFWITPGLCYQDAVHITAILGESVVFNCHVEFPGDHPVPYVLQWEKKVVETGSGIPIYIWYDSYPTHSGEGFEGRVSRVGPDSPYGLASLNLTNIRESDQGWYECKVVFLNRSPNSHRNGTWFHLDVHAPPRFVMTPEDLVYVNLGDATILNCQAEGTPTPEILWYKDANPVDPTATIGIFNDGTELRLSNIRPDYVGDYTCIARNGEGQISHTARVIIAGGAIIMVPPSNQTKQEGEKVQFSCEAKAQPGNVTVKWFREGISVLEVPSLETRVTIKRDGSLIVNPVNADDSGLYTCEVTNGIGEPQSASAYLNVEFPAKVTFTPTVQYLPFRLAGVVQCFIKANPPHQYVTWTKDKRLLEPYQTKDIVIMNNGSLLFTRVNQNHQGRYTCTPYNAQGTQGSSGAMEVLVRKPPVFIVEPESLYQRKVGETVDMHCEVQEAEGTQKPTIRWQRKDGIPLQKNRIRISGGNITIESLRRSDFGYYQCVASNEVATIVADTQLVIEGTQPHAPYNVSGNSTEFAVTLSWLPGYSGGPDYKQDYTIWYREAGISEWSTIPVTPSGSTQITINRLTPGTLYEFQVIGKNALGDGMLSKVITVRTQESGITRSVSNPVVSEHEFIPAPDEADINDPVLTFPTDSTGATLIPPILKPKGPRPGAPRNLTVTEISSGFLISWEHPTERSHLVLFYTIKYRTDAQWKTLNKGAIRAEETQYLVKNLVGGRTYYFRVLANSRTSYSSSEEVKFPVPARVKHKAIKAGVVGGFLFFIVAIILSVCAVKICNKRKRKRQERAYNMVACRITDSRNGDQFSGAAQVPLKNRYSESGISSVMNALKVISRWLPGRGGRVQGDGEDVPDGYRSEYEEAKHLGRISRSADGRFVVESARDSLASRSSSSDDGGFLTRRSGLRLRAFDRASWRRPLVAYPSELSIRSDGTGQSNFGEHNILRYLREKSPSPFFKVPASPLTTPTSSVLAFDRRKGVGYAHSSASSMTRRFPPKSPSQTSQSSYLQRLPQIPVIYSGRSHPSNYGVIFSPSLIKPSVPSTLPRIVSSSPTNSNSLLTPIWSPSYNFSDLSSVPIPSSAERSFPSSISQNRPSYIQLRNVHERYAQELPSLRAIHEETSRLPRETAFFLPVQPSPPRIRIPTPWNDYRARSRLPPRHARQAQSAPELTRAHDDPVSSTGLLMETSPESRSSSSGFGSKNTSSQQNQSSQSGSTSEWRVPPYRTPPPVKTVPHPRIQFPIQYPPSFSPPISSEFQVPPSYLIRDWFDLTTDIQETSPASDLTKVDASVDGHYEFDTAYPVTPTPPIPVSISYPRPGEASVQFQTHFYPTVTSTGSTRPKRTTKYDNIEARVQAMKEEYYAFRRRQEKRKMSEKLESVC